MFYNSSLFTCLIEIEVYVNYMGLLFKCIAQGNAGDENSLIYGALSLKVSNRSKLKSPPQRALLTS
ncbi:hypothetical protein [Candidatus Methylobacter oryzae]|uniref:Uncharacterized protein n=1 Tax=Candidatus Methylobacter oryzae TaxID=2497749 RepID=A0ABY3C8I6_9GAMM|nr:hypothetical protein [Candidatus Methylobacter oryzae]TRW92691.1 hypothetical protein EKO24_014790 [Candidatus Methylobacter oryzae]